MIAVQYDPAPGARVRVSHASSAHGRSRRWWHAVLGVLAVSMLQPGMTHGQSLDIVATWNQILLTAVVAPGANPPTVFVHRPMAIVSVAVFDAANSFDRAYRSYGSRIDPEPGASRDAAVAQAAHDTLVA